MVRKIARLMVSAIVALVFSAASALASGASAAALDVKTERVVIFKDGYCMFIKHAEGRADAAGRAVIEGIPGAMVLGTFWVIPSEAGSARITSQQRIIPGRTPQEAEKSLLLEFGPEAAGRKVELTLLYFTPGIRWIPTYRIVLRDDGTADMAMQAELLNEAEDLAGVDADLVVGVPNFRFKDIVSPMSLEARLRNALQQAAPQLMNQTMSNVLMSQRVADVRAPMERASAPSGAAVPAMPPELAGGESQDLFVYKIPQLTLRRGERAAIPLMSFRVPFRHVYTWDVRLTRSGSEAVPGRGKHASPVRLLKNEVWHQIESTNESDVPWTTGAALIMDGYLPVAQELLTYTSIGAKNRLPLTVAVDIRGTYEEEELGRELRAIRFDGHDYVRISKRGTLRLTNHKKETAAVIVTSGFGGNATKASDKGKIAVGDFASEDWQNFRGNRALTGHSTIKWELELKPGQTKELTCEYFYYTR